MIHECFIQQSGVAPSIESIQPLVDDSGTLKQLETQLNESKEEIGTLKDVTENLEKRLQKAVQVKPPLYISISFLSG